MKVMKKVSKKLSEMKVEVVNMATELGQMKRLKRNNQIIDILQSDNVAAISALHNELSLKLEKKTHKNDWEMKAEGRIS